MSKLCGFSEEEKVGGEETSKTIIYHPQKHPEEVRACLREDDRHCSFQIFFSFSLCKRFSSHKCSKIFNDKFSAVCSLQYLYSVQ